MTESHSEQALLALISEVVRKEVPPLGRDDDLIHELGIDSLTALRVLAIVEKQWGVEFPDERLADFRTLGQILDFLDGRDLQ